MLLGHLLCCHSRLKSASIIKIRPHKWITLHELTSACGFLFLGYRHCPFILILHVASEYVDLFGSRSRRPASVAQLAERLICNQQVAGSSPAASSRRSRMENRSTQFNYWERCCTDVGAPGGGIACRPNRRRIGSGRTKLKRQKIEWSEGEQQAGHIFSTSWK